MTMKTLVAWNTGAVLYQGDFASWKTCLETAVAENVALDYLLLEDVDLGPANLDGARMNYTRLYNCRLTGANLSEATLIKSEWINCDMADMCLTDSVAVGARMIDSRMTGIDVAFADLRGLLVSCPEFLKADFSHSTTLGGGAFVIHGTVCAMTRVPVFIRGLGLDTVLLDEHLILGGATVLRRDQLICQDGLIRIFTEHGLRPRHDQLRNLWQSLRGASPLQAVA